MALLLFLLKAKLIESKKSKNMWLNIANETAIKKKVSIEDSKIYELKSN